jgi:hypothetical protein
MKTVEEAHDIDKLVSLIPEMIVALEANDSIEDQYTQAKAFELTDAVLVKIRAILKNSPQRTDKD